MPHHDEKKHRGTETQRLKLGFLCASVYPLAPPATVRAADTGGTPVRDGRAGVWLNSLNLPVTLCRDIQFHLGQVLRDGGDDLIRDVVIFQLAGIVGVVGAEVKMAVAG